MARKGSGVPRGYTPFPRYGHSLPIVKDKGYLWAGGMREMPSVHASGDKEALMSKVDVFNLKNGKWEGHHVRGSSHSGVSYYATATVGEEIYYFGGQCGHGVCYYNSVTKFAPTEMKWRDMRIIPSGAPMKKYSCGMVSFSVDDQHYLFVVGGYGQLNDLQEKQPNATYVASTGAGATIYRTNEQHILDISKGQWISPTVQGDCPPPCNGFTLTSIGPNKAIMFGGHVSTARGKHRCNDVYIVELAKDSVMWTNLAQPRKDPWPEGRSDHASCLLTGHPARQTYPILVVAGGINNEGKLLRDCWLFNTEAGTWTKISSPESEVGRALMSMSIINIGSQYAWLILFGGAKTWDKGKSSTKEQGLCFDTAVIELGWNADKKEWNVVSFLDNSAVYSHYQHNLKDRLLERRKSLGFD